MPAARNWSWMLSQATSFWKLSALSTWSVIWWRRGDLEVSRRHFLAKWATKFPQSTGQLLTRSWSIMRMVEKLPAKFAVCAFHWNAWLQPFTVFGDCTVAQAKPLGWGDSGKFVFVRYALRLDDACYIYTHCTYMCKNMYYTVYAGLATLSFCFDKLFASALNMFLWHHLAKALISFENPFLRKGGPWREHSPLRIYIYTYYIYIIYVIIYNKYHVYIYIYIIQIVSCKGESGCNMKD